MESNGTTGIGGQEQVVPVNLIIKHFPLHPCLVIIRKLFGQVDLLREDRHEVVVHLLQQVDVDQSIRISGLRTGLLRLVMMIMM